MNIVFVIGVLGNGGAERVIANISNELVKLNWDVNIITIYGNQKDYELNTRVNVIPIMCKSRLRFFRPLERIKSIRNVIKKINPTVVVSFLTDVNIHVISAMCWENTKLVVCERNDPNNDPESKIIRNIRDFLYKKVHYAVFQTPDAMQYFKNILPKNSICEIIPNPIKAELPTYIKEQDSFTFVTACRLAKQKNLYMMIDAINQLIDKGYNCKLEIYGIGPLKLELESYINKINKSNYIFLNGFSKDIHNIMAKSSVFLITSDYEGISNSMLEALAIGIPVIATDCPIGGARLYIKNGINGFLIPCKDVDALVEKLEFSINNRDAVVQMGEKATSIKKDLSVNVITEKWDDYLKSIINS